MSRISTPRPLDLTKPFLTSSQSYDSEPFDLSKNLVTWYRDLQGDFVPDLSGNGNIARAAGSGSFLPVVASIDTPELNYSQLDVRSFSFGGGSSGTEYPHIKTVNSLNAPSASDDHSFTDGTRDLPFSISFWIKPQVVSSQHYVISKINSSAPLSGYEWSVEINNKTLRTILNGSSAAGKYLQCEKMSAVTAGDWYHIVITYNGSESVTGIKMYANGSSLFPFILSSNAYAGMLKTSTPMCIGNKFDSNSFSAVSSEEYDGLIHSIAIWKNRELTATEINALYKAYVNGPGGQPRSGFISRSPRLMIRELDDHPGSYPTVRRTGDVNRPGTLSTNFDDSTTMVFSQAGKPVFPAMLPRGSVFNSQAVDIVGQESDISITAPIRSFQHPAHLHYSPVEEMGPFDENRAAPATDFFLSGTDPDVLPGFGSPIRSKIAIEIDITPQSDTLVMRNVDRRTIVEGGASIGDRTGFLYYNFSRKEWEQIGLIDPATKSQRYFDYAINSTTFNISGTYPSQFHSSPGLPYAEKSTFASLTKEAVGYAKIGSPTIALGAPSLPLYHATQSQALKMSDYIQHPFLLEAVHFEFGEVNAQRVQGNVRSDFAGNPLVSGFTSWPEIVASGSIKDIDNYVFFAYRQSRNNRVVDSTSDVSSSIRNLIFSSSLCFWNSSSLGTGAQSSLLHSPDFDYEFGLPYNDSYAVGQFTGSIDVNLSPSICSPIFSGLASVLKTTATTAVSPSSPTTYTYDCWQGGTSNNNLPENTLTTNFNALETSELASKYSRYDSRSTRTLGGETTAPAQEGFFGIQVSLNDAYSNKSPYLLMPSDEIIFGLEAGVGVYFQQQSFSALTGSFLRIKSKPCKVTLYGSLISDFKEKLPSLNQNLSADSIHEIIGAEPILDQFQIEPISSYYGSYLDEIVTGSMLEPVLGGLFFTTQSQDNSRQVVSRVSLGQAGATGSLQRFKQIADAGELIYDSCLPDYTDIIDFASVESEYRYRGDSVLRYEADSDSIYETGNSFASSIKQFPFENNPIRRTQKTAGIVSIVEAGPSDVMSDPPDLTGITLDSLRTVFLTRYAFVSKAPGLFKPDYTSGFFLIDDSSSNRYNVSNGLVSSYFFTGSVDGILYDQSGNSHDLDLTPDPDGGGGVTSPHPAPSVVPQVVPVDGLFDDASLSFPDVLFDSSVRFVAATSQIDDHMMINGADDVPFSLSITFKSLAVGSEQVLIERSVPGSGATFNTEYRVWIDSAGAINFRIFENGLSDYKSAKTQIGLLYPDLTQWTNVIVTYDGDKTKTNSDGIEIYINGTIRYKIDESTATGVQMYNNVNSRILIAAGKQGGSWEPDESTQFTGFIHSCHIWKNRELTSPECLAISDAELVGVANGVIKHRADFGLKDFEGVLRFGTYRYGISNINQEYSSVVFRPNHFGFFRDIIEQRKDTAFAGSTPIISCRFVSGSTIIDPSLTHSQNISSFSTSSLPYFDDGTFRNRADDPDVAMVI